MIAAIRLFKTYFFLTLLLLSLPFLLGLGCDKTPAFEKKQYVVKDLVHTSNDAKLPESLWNELNKLASEPSKSASPAPASGGHGEAPPPAHGEAPKPEAAEAASGHGAGSGSSAKVEGVETEFFPLKAYLYEKNSGIMEGQNYHLEFGKGGGELDLQKILSDKRGSFYFVLSLPAEFAEATYKVFFLGNNKKRLVDGEKIGNGCQSFFDITSYFKKTLSTEGVLLNTTDGRHISTLGGTFFVAVAYGKKLHLSQLTVTDGRYSRLACR